MAANTSVLYHRWSSNCFQVMAIAEDILATLGMANPAPPAGLDRLVAGIETLIVESQRIGDALADDDLRRVAHDALEAAERIRTVLERTPLPHDHPLREAYEEFADQAEVFALSSDPQTEVDLNRARDDSRNGESIPWERLRGRP
jgi:hypothetical protein